METSARADEKPLPLFVALWPIASLAFVRAWRLLLLITATLAIIAGLVSAAPLYSTVALNVALNRTLTATPDATAIGIHLVPSQFGLTRAAFENYINAEDQNVAQLLSPYLLANHSAYIHYPAMTIQGNAQQQLTLISADVSAIPADALSFDAGRAPHPSATQANGEHGMLEIALPRDAAQSLHAKVGDIITTTLRLTTISTGQAGYQQAKTQHTLMFQVVGIFATTNSVPDSEWTTTTWQSEAAENPTSVTGTPVGAVQTTPMINKALITTADLYALNDAWMTPATTINESGVDVALDLSFSLDPAAITYGHLDALTTQLDTFTQQSALSRNLQQGFMGQSLKDLQVSGQTIGPDSILAAFAQIATAPQIPIAFILLELTALAMLFVSLLVDQIRERLGDMLAVMRSRGVTRSQIATALIAQSAIVCMVAPAVGIFVALGAVYLVAHAVFTGSDRVVIPLVYRNLNQIVPTMMVYALVVACVALVTLTSTLFVATNQTILSVRRANSRNGQRPVWQRLNLDLFVMLLALAAFGASIYLNASGSLDPQTSVQLAPFFLIAPLVLLVGVTLLLSRSFGALLRLASWLVSRRPTAPPVLALAQMARAPGSAIRTLLVLAFALAFSVLMFGYAASQYARAQTAAHYQTAADYFGELPTDQIAPPDHVAARYGKLPGVVAVAAANIQLMTDETLPSGLIAEAIIPADYERTIQWSPDYSDLSLHALMQRLTALETDQNAQRNILPVIVNRDLALAHHLHVGDVFVTDTFGGVDATTYLVAAICQHLPQIADSGVAWSSANYASTAMLIDYPMLRNEHDLQFPGTDPPAANAVWLRATANTGANGDLRAILTGTTKQPSYAGLALAHLIDRHALAATLQHDPFTLDIVGIAWGVGIMALLLAVISVIITTWQSIQRRMTSFATLRALGATPTQLATTILWEEGLIFGGALLLGLLLGWMQTQALIPLLVFTGTMPSATQLGAPTTATGEFYALQRVPDATVVLPGVALTMIVAAVALCLLLVLLMIRQVTHVSLAATLRLNSD